MTLTAEPLTGTEQTEAQRAIDELRDELKKYLNTLREAGTKITRHLQKKIYHAARCAGYDDTESRALLRDLGVPEDEILEKLPVPTRLPGASPVPAKRSVVLAPTSMPGLVPAT